MNLKEHLEKSLDSDGNIKASALAILPQVVVTIKSDCIIIKGANILELHCPSITYHGLSPLPWKDRLKNLFSK